MVNNFKNKFLVPVGGDDERYFELLEKYKKYIGGVYIGWPDAPSGRNIQTATRKFFDRVFEWCRKNKKVFDILFNMQANAYYEGFNYKKINLSPYLYKGTELTFSSIMLLKENIFSGFKKNISVNYKVNFIQQLHILKKEIPDLNSIIVDRDINRDQKRVNLITKTAKKLGINVDILATEGCVPFCPHKIDHNIFITSEHFYPDANKIMQKKSREICNIFYGSDTSNMLRTPSLTLEALVSYPGRFFKISGRELPATLIDEILDYYINRKPIDIGKLFPLIKYSTGVTTDLIPKSFHKKILHCKNECYRCNFCSKIYEKMEAKSKKVSGSSYLPKIILAGKNLSRKC